MNLKKIPLALMLFLLLASALAQENLQPPKIKIVIKELKLKKSTGIIISESEMTRIVFSDVENFSYFDVKFSPRVNAKEEEENIDLIIEGEYEVDENLISLKYQIKSPKTKMLIKQQILRMDLEAVKNEILKNLSELFSSVTFTSDPLDANIEIDGVKFGRTPLTVNYLQNGYHLMHVTKEGYFGAFHELDISKPDTIHIELQKQTTADEAIPPKPKGGMPAIIKNIKYPISRENIGLDGEVVVFVLVDENGNIQKTEIVKSIGREDFDNAAIAAIKSVKWNPSMLKGQPVEGATRVKIKFKSSK